MNQLNKRKHTDYRQDSKKKQKLGNDNKGKDNKSPRARKPDWLYKNERPSTDNLKVSREWNDRPWYWCGSETGGHCKGKWRCHKPSECNPTFGKSQYGKGSKFSKGNNKYSKNTKVGLQEAVTELGEELEGGYESE